MENDAMFPIVKQKIKYLNLIIEQMNSCSERHKNNSEASKQISQMGVVCDEIQTIYENINLKHIKNQESKNKHYEFHPSIEALEKVADFFNNKVLTVLDRLLTDLLKCKQINSKNRKFQEILNDIEFIMQKVERMHQRRIFNYMVDHCTNGTVHLHHYHIEEQKEKKYISIQEIVEDSRMRQKMQGFIETNEQIVSVSHFTYKMKKGAQRLICELLLSGYFFVFRGHGSRLCHRIQQNPNIDCAIHIWNSLNGMKMLYYFLHLFMPEIKYHRVLRIPKMNVSPINLQDIYSKIKSQTIYDIQNNREKIILQYEKEFPKNFDIFGQGHNRDTTTKMRVLCSENVSLDPQQKCDEHWGIKQKLMEFLFSKCLKNKSKNPKQIENVILHIHGGGWVAMSSYSHQIYTRTWANKIKNSIIFSIDYKQTPKHPYPQALDECWQAYLWVKLYAEKHFNIKIKRFYIAGDSAGGNLAMGVCLQSILEGFGKPDGLILSYPSLLLDPNAFSPSILKSFDDIIVPITFLELCIKLYLKDENLQPREDPFLSPIIMPDSIIKLFPPIRMYCGDDDFMIDDSYSFIRKLAHLGADAQLTVYKYLKHGYLNFDIPFAVRDVRKVIMKTASQVNNLISQQQESEQSTKAQTKTPSIAKQNN